MLNGILMTLKKNRLVQQVYRKASFYAFSRTMSHIAPVAVRTSPHSFRRLNLVVPTINRAHIFGGIATALNLYRQLASLLGEEFRYRIILTEYLPDAADLADFPQYRLVSHEEDTDYAHQVLSVRHRAGKPVPVTAGDLFIATQWTTAYLAQRMILAQSALYGHPPTTLYYLIQDYEPGFYPYSSDYLLSEGTYRSAVPQVAIYNSSFLQQFFHAEGYAFAREYCFEPKLNRRLAQGVTGVQGGMKQRQILLYGRPSTPRNGFSLIVEALRIWSAGRPDPAWRILSAGEPHPDVPLGNGMTISSLGKLSLDEYGRVLRDSAVGISLMVSPHPSYPPLEMAHFGMLTITNRFGGKDLSCWHDNIVSPATPSPESLAALLAEQCRIFDADPATGLRGVSRIPSYLDDSPPFPFLDELADGIVRHGEG